MFKFIKLLCAALMFTTSINAAYGQTYFGLTVPKISVYDRDQVVNLIKTYHVTPLNTDRVVPLNWTGNVASCDAGTSNKAYQQLVLQQTNMMRATVGQANVVMVDDALTKMAQDAMLIMLANETVTHTPAPTVTCYTESGRQGAWRSELALAGASMSPSTASFIDDYGANNYFVGHRQKVLSEELHAAGIGMGFSGTPSYPLGLGSQAMLADFNYIPADSPSLITWPSAGFFPAEWLPGISRRWSVGCSLCDTSNVSISVQIDGVSTPVTLEPALPFAYYYYRGTAVFLMPELRLRLFNQYQSSPLWKYPVLNNFADVPVDITVRGMIDARGQLIPDFSYRVTLINSDNTTGKVFPTVRYDGQWSVAGQDGWSLHLQAATTGSLTGKWFSYAADGSPTWYTLADGRWLTPSTYIGKLYSATGTAFNATPNPAQTALTLVGGATLTFSATNAAKFDFVLNGVPGTANISRPLLGAEEYVPGTHNFTGQWASAGERAAGFSVAQDYRSVAGVWYTFGLDGRAIWYRTNPGSVSWNNNAATANNFVANLQATRGTPATQTWNPTQFSVTQVGTVSFSSAWVAPSDPAITPSLPDENNILLSFSFTGTGAGAPAVYTAAMRKQANDIYSQGNAAIALSKRGGIDIDGNGKSQLVVRSVSDTGTGMQVGRWMNNAFQWSSSNDPGPNYRILGATDLSGTGKSDLLFQNITQGEFGDVYAWRNFNAANQTFVRTVKRTWDVQALGDLDGDGKGDMVWRYTVADSPDTGVSYIWFTDIDSAAPVNLVRKRGGAPLNWTLLGAADINGDGAADMVYITPANQVRVLMATGSTVAARTCANYLVGSLPVGFTAVKFADFTGSRRGGDILMRNAITGEVRLMSLNANGVQLPVYAGDATDRNAACTGAGGNVTIPSLTTSVGSVDPSWAYVATGDFNGDGTFDIVWKKPDGSLVVWFMQQAGSPAIAANAGMMPAGYTAIGLQ